jgi:DNA integrity scanning protein DisA with diadenylate cyclase activity
MRKYKVKKKFRYNDRIYVPGDLWYPQGGKFDQQILYQGYYVDIKPVIQKIDEAIVELLASAGFENANDIQSAKDEDLLKIKGIGQKKLELIREIY